jgi:solute:Na+ symporter, SSS family
VMFAAPFWVGMFWRRGTTAAAWSAVAYCALIFFLIPFFGPQISPSLRLNENLTQSNRMLETITTRKAAPTDVAIREARIEEWDTRQQEAEANTDSALRDSQLAALGPRPEPLVEGDTITETERTGGRAIFWTGKLTPVDAAGNVIEAAPQPVGEPQQLDANTTQVELAYGDDVRFQGQGNLQVDMLLYPLLGVNLSNKSNAMLDTLNLPPKIITPFLVMILISLITPRCGKDGLDRFYTKMKTPVHPDPATDHKNLEEAYKNPESQEAKKLLPGTSFEFQKPTVADIVGFIICFGICFAIIGLAVLVAQIGA